jgi:hypothetical protein
LLSLIKEALVRKGKQEPGQFAPGLPSKTAKKPIPSIKEPKDWEFSEQIHDAQRAKRHSDLRLSDGRTAFSWALRKGLPAKPGEKRLAIRQPDHSPSYITFRGSIKSGYGKGRVRLNRYGDVRILSASKNKIHFATLDTKNPQEYTMVRTPKMGEDRWLVLKTTPTTDSHPHVPTTREKFREASLEDIGRFMTNKWIMASKIDGGGVTVDVGKRTKVFSQNKAKGSNELINHTHLLDLGTPPASLRGTQMRAEIFGKKGKEIIPQRELAGIMNSSPAKARRDLKRRGIKLMLAPWKMLKFRGERVDDIPYDDQIDLMKSVSRDLPGKFVLPSIAKTPGAKANLIQKIREGRHHLTGEGVMVYPKGGVDSRAYKVPFKKHTQVYIREVYRLKVMGKEVDLAGGFKYSLTPRGHIVGKVGSGFDARQRKEYWQDRKALVGKKALIHSKGQFPSGAYRAPAFISLHL